MKTVKQKKLVLNNAILEEEFFEDTQVIGIVCPLASNRFVWHIEQDLNIGFARNHSFEIAHNDRFFEVYSYFETPHQVEHFLYTNRKGTDFLLNELKSIDFLWMSKGHFTQHQIMAFLPDMLQKMKVVDYSIRIDPFKLNSKHLLVL